jgi:hypothetical protein
MLLLSSTEAIVQTMHKLVILRKSRSPMYLTLYTFQRSPPVAMNSNQPRLFENVFEHQVEYHKIAKLIRPSSEPVVPAGS